MTTQNKLLRGEERTLGQIMEKVCATDENGYAVYAPGWSDARCQQELEKAIGRAVSITAVSGYRRDIFGRFFRDTHPKKVPSAPADEAAKVDDGALRSELAQLKKEMAEMKAELTHTMARLSLRMDELDKNNSYMRSRDEKTQTHLIGLYARVAKIETRAGIVPTTPALSALGDQIVKRYGSNGSEN